ncbi:MAG TPA: tetratricopeptide repeat protein [Sphingobacteriaceae bacterium]
MNIKSLILALAITGSSVFAFAQKGELNSAKTNYDKFSVLKGANSLGLAKSNLQTAKASIDKASAHEKTMNDPSTWTYKALIYADLALMDSVPTTSEPLLKEATSALQKAVSLDKEGANKENFNRVNDLLAQYHLNVGVRAFQAKNFKDALKGFNNSLTYRPNDTTITYYSGLAAINAQDYAAATKAYESLVKTDFSANKQVYLDLSRIYAMQKDTVAAIKAAAEGSAKFPADADLARQEIELNLLTGKQKEVIGRITAQAEKEPNNRLYPFYLGVAYATANNTAKAEESYKKAIAIDANYADATLNLGGLILNNGIELYNSANKLPQSKQKEYDAMMKKANAEFDRALPYLTKATELSPKSRMAWENLRAYYQAKRNTAKIAEINKKLQTLE